MRDFMPRLRFSVAGLFLAGLLSASAQGTTPATNAPSAKAPAAPAPYAIGDVINQAQAASVKFQDDKNQINPDTVAQETRDSLATITHTIDRRLEIDHAYAESSPSLTGLQNSQTAWQEIAGQLDDLLGSLSDRVNRQHALLADLASLKATWTATQQSAAKAQAPAEIVQTIQQVLSQIDDILDATNADLQGLYKLQIATAQQAGRVKTGLNAMNTEIIAAQTRLFEQTQPALWSPASFSAGNEGMVGHERTSLAQQFVQVRGYLAPRIGAILLQGLLLAILVALFYWIRNVLCARSKEDTGLCEAHRIFSAPLATALLLALVTSNWFYPHDETPRLLWSLIGAAILIPTVIIVRRLISPELMPLLYAMVIAYILDQVRFAATREGPFARFLLLAELIAACLFVLGALRSKRLSDAGHRNLAEKRLRVYLHAAFFIALAAGFANILGYGQLTLLMGNALFESSYLAVLFYAAVRIIDALVLALLSVRPLSSFGMVRHHQQTVYGTTTTIIRWIATVVWTLLALQLFSLRNPLFAKGQALLATHLRWGAIDLQVGALLAFPITVWAAFALSRLIRFALEEDVYPNLHLPRGIPYAISSVVHYAILVFGLFTALGAMGIDLGNYAVLGGAFGVGLGFGLQNIMNNFISGLILLFERPIKVGDTVQIDANTIGRVERIGIRASVILLTNGSELIMPNGNLISNPVTNWTLSNCERLLEIPVNIAPKSNIDRALDLFLAAARANRAVLKNPPPQAIVVAIAAAATSLKLRCWVDSEEVDWMKITSELSVALQLALEKENIPLA